MSSSGQVLIVGSKVERLVARLEARGYGCTSGTAKTVDSMAAQARPDVIVLATAATLTSSTLQRLRKHPALKAVPVLVESRGGSARSLTLLDVDGVAESPEELERLIKERDGKSK